VEVLAGFRSEDAPGLSVGQERSDREVNTITLARDGSAAAGLLGGDQRRAAAAEYLLSFAGEAQVGRHRPADEAPNPCCLPRRLRNNPVNA
jgi:hypothetical protein